MPARSHPVTGVSKVSSLKRTTDLMAEAVAADEFVIFPIGHKIGSAQAGLPAWTPEFTDLNDTDPGVTALGALIGTRFALQGTYDPELDGFFFL